MAGASSRRVHNTDAACPQRARRNFDGELCVKEELQVLDPVVKVSGTKLSLAYSPDSDDAFMFRAAIEGLIDNEGLEWLAQTRDTEALNESAARAEADIMAVS